MTSHKSGSNAQPWSSVAQLFLFLYPGH